MIIFLRILVLFIFLLVILLGFLGFFGVLMGFRERKIGWILLSVAGLLLVGGLYLNKFNSSYSSRQNLTALLLKGEISGVYSNFKDLSNSDKEYFVKQIYEKFYDGKIKKKIEFINSFSRFNLQFVDKVKLDLDKEISSLYLSTEHINTSAAWRIFTSEVPMDYFVNDAGESIKNIEFSKWRNTEEAWNRVVLLNSNPITFEFLKRYSRSEYECEAKKMILDNLADTYKYPYIRNSCGQTFVTISNTSYSEITFKYNGTFDEGSVTIGSHSKTSLSLKNGYYKFNASANNAWDESTHEVLNGQSISIEYSLTRKS